jgi:hypothetical protein
MCDNCGCGSSASMMDVGVMAAMGGLTDYDKLGTNSGEMQVQSAPPNTVGN